MALRLSLRKSVHSLLGSGRGFSTIANILADSSAPSFPEYVLRAPTTDVTTLDSGLRVASETVLGSETATVGVFIDAGSRYETTRTNGAAHFLEHMAFKGTVKRTQEQLELEIENMGGHLNAYTSREQTVYFAKVFKKDVGKALEILSDILLNSKLEESAIERERDVILKEMTEVNKKQDELVLDHLHATAYQGTPLGFTILGPEENILSLKRKDLTDYIQTHYTAPRMVIAGAGAINHEEFCGMAAQAFGSLPKAPSQGSIDIAMDPAVFTGSDIRVRFDSMDKAHVALAFEGASWTSEYAFPLMLMQLMLGSYDRTSGMGRNVSTRFSQAVAETECAHSVSCFNTSYKDTGLFGVYFVAPEKKLDEIMYITLENLVRLVHVPTDEEVECAKVDLKANMLMALDGNSNITEDIGRQLLTYGRRLTAAEIFSRIDSITVDDIKATAAKVINDQDHVLAAVGCIHELQDYAWIRRHSYWLRY